MTDLILETRNLSKSFPIGGNKQITALEDISLQVNSGEFLSILGPTGAGKSTLLRMLVGLSEPSVGDILYHGVPLRTAKARIAMVFQSFALFPWLTVLENVELGLKAYRLSAAEVRERSIKMLDLVGLDGFEEAYPRELSGGMRQKVGIARALVTEPEVLFMDEPFSALDVLTADNLRGDLADLWMEKKMPIKSILLVTHNIAEAVWLSDRAIILSHNPGRIKADLPIELPHPRNRNSREFKFIVDRIYEVLTKPAEQIPFLIRHERYQFLPHAKVGAIAGLIELVHERGGTTDISALASDLSMEIDDIFPLIEASVFLGLGQIKEGDFIITEKGKRFSEADILKRKEIFKETAIDNIQLIKQIVQVLSSTSKRRISEEFLIETLRNHFTEDEAWEQLETAIDWGRYSELFAYDYDAGELYLETDQAKVP